MHSQSIRASGRIRNKCVRNAPTKESCLLAPASPFLLEAPSRYNFHDASRDQLVLAPHIPLLQSAELHRKTVYKLDYATECSNRR